MTTKECNRCKGCRYYDGSGAVKTCNYILTTGVPRGCKVNEECEKYEKFVKK